MTLKLIEALNIPNAEVVAENVNGFDLFRIRTWAAAQSFVVDNSETLAGEYWTHNENIFNSNINDQQLLYFFAHADSNRVIAAVVFDNGSHRLILQDGGVNITGNFDFESCNDHHNNVPVNLPLFAIPDAHLSYNNIEIDQNNGYILSRDRTLIGISSSCAPVTHIDLLDTNMSNIEAIDEYALKYGVSVDSIIVGDTLNMGLSANFFRRYKGEILVTADEKPESWPDDWCSGNEDHVHWSFGKSEEEIAQIQAARQEREETEKREREETEARRLAAEEEERRQKEEQERLAAEREARKIRYKVEGNEVTILGTRRGVDKLEIPSEIEGKPVTKIAPFAFYDSEIKNISNDSTSSNLREIGKGAFADCSYLEKLCQIYTTRNRDVQVRIPRGVCANSHCVIIDAFGRTYE